jgi:hypothetical protein
MDWMLQLHHSSLPALKYCNSPAHVRGRGPNFWQIARVCVASAHYVDFYTVVFIWVPWAEHFRTASRARPRVCTNVNGSAARSTLSNNGTENSLNVIDRAAIIFFDMECGFILALFLCALGLHVRAWRIISPTVLVASNEIVCFRVSHSKVGSRESTCRLASKKISLQTCLGFWMTLHKAVMAAGNYAG